MSEVKKWYIGVYGGEAQARPCSPAEFEIIRDRDRRYFVIEEDFDRVTAERDAILLQVRAWSGEAKAQRATVNEVGAILGGIPDWGPIAAKVGELQQRLTAADERADVLEGLLREARHNHGLMLMSDPPRDAWKHHRMNERIDAALKPAPGEPDRINGMIETVGGEYAVMIDRANSHYGWTFKKHPDGQWVSGRKATEREMIAARSHAQITNQL